MKRDKRNTDDDRVAQRPGLTGAESSGSSGIGGKQNRDEPNSSSGAMDGQGTFGSGANGPGMKQPGSSGEAGQEKRKAKSNNSLQQGLGRDFLKDSGDPESALNSLI